MRVLDLLWEADKRIQFVLFGLQQTCRQECLRGSGLYLMFVQRPFNAFRVN